MTGSLANLIIKKLEESSIWNGKEGDKSNIILFSDADVFSKTPYAVVKPETGIRENTRAFRIIAHMDRGFLDELENYVLKELDSLLLSDYLIDEEGGRFKLYPSGYTDVTPEKEDNSYFMERLYYSPLTVRN